MVYRKQKSNTYFELRIGIVIEYHHGHRRTQIPWCYWVRKAVRGYTSAVIYSIYLTLILRIWKVNLKKKKYLPNESDKSTVVWADWLQVLSCIENCQVFLLYLSSWSRRLEFISSSWCERCFRSKRRPGLAQALHHLLASEQCSAEILIKIMTSRDA